jgi:hypothetical protein
MVQYFSEMVKSASTGEKSAIRALQAWQYLIGKAYNRQTIRYGELAKQLGYSDSRPLSSILGHIMFYCQQNELPPLTIIVVSKDGTPGEGFTDADPNEFHRRREDVFNYEWYAIAPPSIEQFREAWEKGKE